MKKITRYIRENLFEFKLAFNPVSLDPLSAEEMPVALQAFEKIRANIAVVNQIRNLPEAEFERFLSSVKIQTYRYDDPDNDSDNLTVAETLVGLSSFDGTRLYLAKNLFVDEQWVLARRTIEHEIMHNLSRWGLDNPKLISPFVNWNLRSRNGSRMIEAGHFYEEQVYDEIMDHPSPFCMLESSVVRKLF
jgi:hypothetical protein